MNKTEDLRLLLFLKRGIELEKRNLTWKDWNHKEGLNLKRGIRLKKRDY